MTHAVRRIPLIAMAPGTERSLLVHCFGTPGARPKAYLQAGIHADEIPGLLVLQHLIGKLMEADSAGDILGEIIVVPFANPIGLGQRFWGDLLGRHEFRAGGNFNRGFPSFDEAIGDRVEGKLGPDAEENIALIRAAFMAEVEAYPANNELLQWRREVMRLAGDADFVFDLHCDSEAVLYLYLGTQNWPDAADFSAQMGSLATLLTYDSGGGSFDECFSRPWWSLSKRFGDEFPIPPACLASTIELRGTADVGDEFAAGDADNLYRFFQRRGVIAGDAGPLPEARCDATPLDGVPARLRPYAVAPTAEPANAVFRPDRRAHVHDRCQDGTRYTNWHWIAVRVPSRHHSGTVRPSVPRTLACLLQTPGARCRSVPPVAASRLRSHLPHPRSWTRA